MESVLVPVDGSDASAHAAAWAARYAAARGAELILLHLRTRAGGRRSSTRRPAATHARAAIGHATAARTLVSIGDPAEEIVALARRERASLIVMGSRGLSPVRELLLGSVSEKVIRHAHCAVTVVR